MRQFVRPWAQKVGLMKFSLLAALLVPNFVFAAEPVFNCEIYDQAQTPAKLVKQISLPTDGPHIVKLNTGSNLRLNNYEGQIFIEVLDTAGETIARASALGTYGTLQTAKPALDISCSTL